MKTQNVLNVSVSKSQKEIKHLQSIWIPEMHKNPTGARFTIVSKICSTKQISKSVSNVFKLIYSQIENFCENANFLSNYNNLWVLQNFDSIIQFIKKYVKSISTLCTKLRHDKLKSKPSSIVDVALKGGDKNFYWIF